MQLYKLHIWFVVIAFFVFGVGGVAATPDAKSLTIADYANITQFSELALSSDGEWVAFAIEPSEESRSRKLRSFRVQRATANAKPLNIFIAQDARNLAWIPGAYELAYISASDGVPQVYKTNIETKKTKRLTSGPERVLSFRFSGDGKKLAWIAQGKQAERENSPSLYNRLHHGDTGVVIDHRNTRLTHFINPNYREMGAQAERFLRIAPVGGKAIKVNSPGNVTGFEWSPSGEKLSIRYLDKENYADPFSSLYTSIGVFDIATQKFTVMAKAVQDTANNEAVYYLGGEWAGNDSEIFVRRVRPSGYWRARRDWRRVAIDEGEISSNADASWKEVSFYPASAPIMQRDGEAAIAYGVSKARRAIYLIDQAEPMPAPEVENIKGDIALPRYSSDGSVLAFVNESLTRAPEVFVSRNGAVIQITDLNDSVNSKKMPDARRVEWRGEDGVTVQGWLLMPPGDADKDQPLPMVTFLHGGPTPPMTNSFAQYYKMYGGVWPYPLEVLALNGVAVFIPNYRGTEGFGHDYANPKHSDVEALGDVILGIESLVEAGLADEQRLGIAGHSHGAWLGAMVMTRMKNFVAASFGEGPQNNMLTYVFSPGYLYEQGYHKLWGSGLYENPQRYIETSPVFYFDGLKTAALFEAGVESQALSMMGSPKAAHLAGMPTEFVAYPRTGHNIRGMKLKQESAHRNLDWFLFWMLGQESQDIAKAGQYARWREMRDNSCNNVESAQLSPAYCEFNSKR